MDDLLDEHVGRLRASVLALKAPQAAKRAPAPTSSVYGRAAAALPADVQAASSQQVLAARFRNVETSALVSGTSMALVILPTAGPVPSDLRRSMSLLVAAGAVVVILGPDMPRDVPADRSRLLTVPLRVDDALANEWAILACGPAKRVAFLARRQDDDRWMWLLTRDAVAVFRAGTAILERVPFLGLRVPPLQR